MMHVNIIARTNGVGLDRDVDLAHDVATKAGFHATISHCRSISPLQRWLPQKKRFDANIFLERVFPAWLGAAKKNLLIPNQERFPNRHIQRLKKIDHVLCKTKHGLASFEPHHSSCHWIGFTSADLRDTAIPKKRDSFLHLAGRSTLKGTEDILALWANHPEWPTLTIIQCRENAPSSVPDNVKLITDYLSNEEIARYMNEHRVHLCLSRSEGWGHYLAEAMACEAIAVTTDAPPMNELVTPERGFLVPFQHSEPRHLGTNFFFNPQELEKSVTQILSTPPEALAHIGKKGRQWYEENDQEFRDRTARLLRKLIPRD